MFEIIIHRVTQPFLFISGRLGVSNGNICISLLSDHTVDSALTLLLEVDIKIISIFASNQIRGPNPETMEPIQKTHL